MHESGGYIYGLHSVSLPTTYYYLTYPNCLDLDVSMSHVLAYFGQDDWSRGVKDLGYRIFLDSPNFWRNLTGRWCNPIRILGVFQGVAAARLATGYMTCACT
jgi:hypothetical protein